MSEYAFSATYTEDGLERLRSDGANDRFTALSDAATSVGGQVLILRFLRGHSPAMWLARGASDVVCLVGFMTFPDMQSVNAFAFALEEGGLLANVRLGSGDDC